MTKIVKTLGSWLRRLAGSGRPEPSPEETERLSAVFRERYHSFRILLAANGNALENMAAMEQAHAGSRPYGMDFVVSNTTSLSVCVYRMIQNLDSLAPNAFTELFSRFDEIRGELEAVIHRKPHTTGAPIVMRMTEIGRTDSHSVGAKMANLGECRNALGLEIPVGFVVTAAAFGRLLDHNDLRSEIQRLVQSTEIDRSDTIFALSSRLRQLIATAEVPSEIRDAVDGALTAIRDDVGLEAGFAVRSSAFGEDSGKTSFAGLYETQLNVHRENLLAAYQEIAASTYTPQAMVYRRQHGLRDDDTEMSVGCMAMIDAMTGGVAYTSDPHDAADRNIRISAAFGLPKAVVDGRFDADLFVVDRTSETLIERRIARKTTAFALGPGEGITRRSIADETARRPALSDEKVLEIARIALRVEAHFGEPQDVEWAVRGDGRVVVLQARPMHFASAPRSTPAIHGEPLVSGGACVSPGAAAGPVSWVRSDREALKMPEGAVLVIDYPDPRWAALLDRAAAVVAEHGGIAGHLATVAREFGVPAIFGLGSLDALGRGEEITVDADGLAIHRGRIPDLDTGPRRPNLMDGSPIQSTLRDALAHIAPLHLLDPQAPEFRPGNVRTLHDITRFCHEMAVREMFAFGKRHRFPRYAAKQLHHNVPMQWWVLNLDDGFTEELSGKYVHLDEISCAPMHALWEGMVAIPWDGPPAVSGSGLASVLFEATRNPALATPFRKPYANRNYFMVSKNFMNLQSRFGFHFSTVEILASERDSENYLVFSLKGGAADQERRAARAQFIADILAGQGFHLKVIEDTVTARVSALPQEALLEMVRIVGYLLMHTRQLDMVMGSRQAVDHYRAKLEGDIASLAARSS